MTRRILFVDDEPRVLDGLRRMLRVLRDELEMEFASGGPEALRVLERSPVDVLVTDMRMPGMDGIQLLEEVRQRFPRVARIVLTGQCDREAVFRAMALAHRQLAKPCDAETLKEAVSSACALQSLLQDRTLLELASRLESVPSLPSLYLEVVEELKSSETSLDKVGQIISRDVGMTVKIMQVVNSAFFGLRRKVTSPAQAVLLLGVETTRALVLAASLFTRFDASAVEGFSLDALWAHSYRTGCLARAIAKAERADNIIVEFASMAGLLHDVGRLVLVAQLPPPAYKEVLAHAREAGLPVHDAERAAFGASHAEVGAYLLGLWGLPSSVVEAVAWHHGPSACPGQTFSPLTAVHAANILDHEERTPEARFASDVVDAGYLERLGLTGRLEHWRALRPSRAEEE